jgi:hypothetical protein
LSASCTFSGRFWVLVTLPKFVLVGLKSGMLKNGWSKAFSSSTWNPVGDLRGNASRSIVDHAEKEGREQAVYDAIVATAQHAKPRS